MTPPSDLQRTVDRLETESRLYREGQTETNQRIEKKLDDHIAEYKADRKGDKVLRFSLFAALITSSGTVMAATIALLAGGGPK